VKLFFSGFGMKKYCWRTVPLNLEGRISRIEELGGASEVYRRAGRIAASCRWQWLKIKAF
jgi:hypothetical protein